MKRSRTIALVLALSAFAAASQAQDAPPIARYVPPGPDQRHVFVTDSAHILSAATISALQDSAQALQAATGADVAWITLPTLGGRSIEEATVYLGRTWRIGSAGQPGDPLRNRGLVILYIPDKSKTAGSNFRVEVGTGLQGTIIDSRSRAISTAMREDLRAKRYDDGYLKGWNVAAMMVREDFASRNAEDGAATAARSPVVQTLSARRLSLGWFVPIIVLAAILGVITFVIWIVFRRRATMGASASPSTPMWMAIAAAMSEDDDRRRRGDSDSSWFGSDSGGDSGSSGDSGGGDFGGGGGFDGGGSSDSI